MMAPQHVAAVRPLRLVRWLDAAIPFILGAVIAALLMLASPLVTDEPQPAPRPMPVVQPDPLNLRRMTETARTLGRYAHAIYDVWMRDPERHFGDHAMAQIVADLLTALAAEEYDQASTLLVCVDGRQRADDCQQ